MKRNLSHVLLTWQIRREKLPFTLRHAIRFECREMRNWYVWIMARENRFSLWRVNDANGLDEKQRGICKNELSAAAPPWIWYKWLRSARDEPDWIYGGGHSHDPTMNSKFIVNWSLTFRVAWLFENTRSSTVCDRATFSDHRLRWSGRHHLRWQSMRFVSTERRNAQKYDLLKFFRREKYIFETIPVCIEVDFRK